MQPRIFENILRIITRYNPDIGTTTEKIIQVVDVMNYVVAFSIDVDRNEGISLRFTNEMRIESDVRIAAKHEEGEDFQEETSRLHALAHQRACVVLNLAFVVGYRQPILSRFVEKKRNCEALIMLNTKLEI